MASDIQIQDYYWATKSGFPESLAPIVGKELMALRARLKRGPTARDVLAEARRTKTSGLSKLFDWDKNAAAEAQWLNVASAILRSIRVRMMAIDVTRESEEPTMIDVRLFHNVLPKDATLDNEGRVYLPATETLTDSSYRHQLLDAAISELDKWTNRYHHLQELDVFFRKLEEAKRLYVEAAA